MQKTFSNSGKFLSSPISFLLIFLWIANDHFWKAQFHNEITGKISDITGLIVFPFFLTAISFIISYGTVKEKTLFVFTNLSIATLFSVINWNQDWNNWIYANCFGNQNGTADKTDLLCVPVCLLANYYLYKKYSAKEILVSAKIQSLHVIAITLSALAFINTSVADKKDSPREPYGEEIQSKPSRQFISIARPLGGEEFKIDEEVVFIWYTEETYKEFWIFISNYPQNTMIRIPMKQLEQRLDERNNLHYYVLSQKLPEVELYSRNWTILGYKGEGKEFNLENLYTIILKDKCFYYGLHCPEFREINLIK